MVFDHIFKGQMAVDCLEVVGQPVVSPAKIIALVLKPRAEIPLAGNKKAVVVTEIVVKRVTFAESWFVFEIAAQRIIRLDRKDVVRIFVRWFGSLLNCRFGPREYAGAGKNRENRQNE